ncbi:MAG: nicotinate-nucleotide adenylyltransferase [Pseudomonadota bacterium]
MEDYLRVGLFGGTFNPIHLGHLRSAEEVRELFNLKQVIFIPSANPPHKQGKDIISPIHRMEMVNIAIEENQSFSVSDIEIKRQGKSYSIETIDHIRQINDSDLTLFFIIGIDAFTEISTWKDYTNLFSRCNFVVTTRPGYSLTNLEIVLPADVAGNFTYSSKEDRFIHPSNFSLYFRDITNLDISSSVVRKRIKENRSVRYFLPEKVIEYIQGHGLYKDS